MSLMGPRLGAGDHGHTLAAANHPDAECLANKGILTDDWRLPVAHSGATVPAFHRISPFVGAGTIARIDERARRVERRHPNCIHPSSHALAGRKVKAEFRLSGQPTEQDLIQFSSEGRPRPFRVAGFARHALGYTEHGSPHGRYRFASREVFTGGSRLRAAAWEPW